MKTAHVSAERSGDGAERAENGVSGSGAVSGHSRKRLSGSGAWSAAKRTASFTKMGLSAERQIGLLILTRFSNLSTGAHRLFLPLRPIRFSAVIHCLPVHITFAISLPSSLHDPLGRCHWSLSFTHTSSVESQSSLIIT